MHKVDIVLATYNGAKFISEQIDSILKQSFTGWKLLIHDDGSSDETVEIILSFVDKHPSKIEFFNDDVSFGGALENFDFLLEKSKANYIMFCDQDDIWLANKIEITLNKTLKVEESNPNIPILIHTDLKVVNEDLTLLSESYWFYQNIDPKYNTFSRLIVQNVITGCSVMINRKLADISLPIPREAVIHDSWLGLIASNFGKIRYVTQSTMKYRQHKTNTIGAKGFTLKGIYQKMFKKDVLENNIKQAKAFLEIFRDKLDKSTFEMLEDFSTIESKSFWQKRKILLKHKLLKQGFVRNMGLLLKI
jgi:glycosyltransferase involved in cell wall biosynthesis